MRLNAQVVISKSRFEVSPPEANLHFTREMEQNRAAANFVGVLRRFTWLDRRPDDLVIKQEHGAFGGDGWWC